MQSIFFYRIIKMSWLLRGRELFLGAYDHLPNVFIIGSLLVGAMTGIVPLLILGLVTTFLGVILFGFQTIMGGIIGEGTSLFKYLSSIGPCNLNKIGSNELLISSWASITTFIFVYLFMNALAVYQLPIATGVDPQLVANRQAYMISIMVSLSIIGLILLGSRVMLGCETKLMGVLSLALGAGTAYGMWNLVSLNGNDIRMGDIFQVRNNMANTGLVNELNPVMCVAPQ
jgi:hypothetical protein